MKPRPWPAKKKKKTPLPSNFESAAHAWSGDPHRSKFNEEELSTSMATAPEPGKGGPSAQLVKELRDKTSAGFSDCRAALVESGGDIEQAISILRKKGQVAAAKKAQRATSEGLVSCYIHAGGKIGVLIEINCESDFVARTEGFQGLCHDVAMHIAALAPLFLRREDVTQEILDSKRATYREEAKATGKPEAVVEKIVTGKMEKFYEENCLYEQHFIKDEGTTVKELVDQAIAKVGENIAIRRFSRFKVGEMDGAAAAPSASDESDAPIPAPKAQV
jgi:elongation factor Ts